MVDDITLEVWRPIHGDYYEVSSLGNVRRAKPGISTFVGRPLLPVIAGNGYPVVMLGGNSPRRAYVHHLVAEAFIGPRDEKLVVNHLDGNRQNNAAANLEYVSAAENARHAVANLVRRRGPKMPSKPKPGRPTGAQHWTKKKPDRIARADRMPQTKLSAESVREIRRRAAAGETQKAIASEVGVSATQLSRIVRGQRWTYVS